MVVPPPPRALRYVDGVAQVDLCNQRSFLHASHAHPAKCFVPRCPESVSQSLIGNEEKLECLTHMEHRINFPKVSHGPLVVDLSETDMTLAPNIRQSHRCENLVLNRLILLIFQRSTGERVVSVGNVSRLMKRLNVTLNMTIRDGKDRSSPLRTFRNPVMGIRVPLSLKLLHGMPRRAPIMEGRPDVAVLVASLYVVSDAILFQIGSREAMAYDTFPPMKKVGRGLTTAVCRAIHSIHHAKVSIRPVAGISLRYINS